MSTALQICANAYRQANVDQDLTAFSTSAEYPYNIAQDLLNEVINEINRAGDLYCLEASQTLTYSPGTYTYDLSSAGLSIDPRKVTSVERTGTSQPGELKPCNAKTFRYYYRQSAVQTMAPTHYTIYNQLLEFNTIPDQDYTIKVYYYQTLAPVTTTTATFPLPPEDEDVLRQGVYAMLLQRLGRPDFATAFQLFQATLKSMKAETKRSSALPQVMPAAF